MPHQPSTPDLPTHDTRTTIVTGATSGIGRACALRLAADGGHVVLAARTAPDLADLAEECLREGASSAMGVVTDVADDGSVRDLVARTLAEHRRLDAVVHCAGVVTYGRAEDVSAADFEQVVATNLLGSAAVARHVVPVLRRQRRGDLVLVGSLLGHIAVPRMTPYVVSKWGVRALARQLQIENVDLPGVRISHVAPGSVDTPIYDNAIDDAGMVNTPPPPTISPERAAAVVVGAIGGRRRSVQTALSNYVLVAAYAAVPWAYDRLVGPVFDAVSQRRRDDGDRRSGSVDQGSDA